jgi:hypothetical protein
MVSVRYIASSTDIPAGEKYVLVEFGGKDAMTRHDRGLTFTVARSDERNLREAHAETAIGDAQAAAVREGIDTVFVTIPERGA